MKNKFKKVIATSLAVSVLLAFTGCGSNQAPSADNKKQESASTSTTDTAGMDEQSKKRDDLYQQENQLFADHKDAWDKVFGLMNKNSAGESLSENYADLLAGTVESNKDSFTEEEYDTLCKDIETIRGIEEELAAIEKEIAEADSANGGSSESDESISLFQDFTGKDLDGKDVDESVFKNNKVTVVNFWFSGCKPCVEELSKLNELNETLKTMGGEVVGQRGKTINAIIDETGVKIDITDDGAVSICGTEQAMMDQAKKYIEIIASDFTEGQILTGKVVSIKDFGAFLEFAPGKEGLVHISKLAKQRVEKVEDVVSLGDVVKVVCMGKDKMGRVSFSIKDVPADAK